jgi:hypothetical protein
MLLAGGPADLRRLPDCFRQAGVNRAFCCDACAGRRNEGVSGRSSMHEGIVVMPPARSDGFNLIKGGVRSEGI